MTIINFKNRQYLQQEVTSSNLSICNTEYALFVLKISCKSVKQCLRKNTKMSEKREKKRIRAKVVTKQRVDLPLLSKESKAGQSCKKDSA